MLALVLQRLQRMVITLLAIVTAAFLAIRLVPGNPALFILGDRATPELIRVLERDMALDQPIWAQYGLYINQLLHGDLGYSYVSRLPTIQLMAAAWPFTVHLAAIAFGFALVAGILSGVIAARFHGTSLDLGIMSFNTFWMSVPFFWLGLLLLLLFSVGLHWLPLTGAGNLADPADLAQHLVLPALAVGLREAAIISRLTRSSVLEVLSEDYVRTARAKGLDGRAVLGQHVLKNALPQIISIAGIELIALLGGSMIVEIVFSRPGLGTLFIQSVIARDYPMVQASVLLVGLIVTTVNFAAELAYGVADPRIRAA
jgi:peptide/nickel transport system permease protein